jgi:hypothetical protein
MKYIKLRVERYMENLQEALTSFTQIATTKRANNG